MEPLKTTTISYDNGIYAIDQQMVRAFLIVGKDRALLLDAGAVPTDIKKAISEITGLPLTVALTHSDGDHIGNLSAFDEAYCASADMAAIHNHEGCGHVKLRPLANGQVFDLGDRTIEALFTPGHTPGSVCFLDRENRLLFSGDTVSYGPVFMFGEKRNLNDFLNTLETLKELKDQGVYDTVYCCHNACPIPADTVEELIACTKGVLDGSIPGSPAPMHGQTPLLGKYGTCGILFPEQKK